MSSTVTQSSQILQAIVKRGKAHGATLRPHRYADGSYVASRSRYERNYIRVSSLSELIQLWQQGFKVRMSATLEDKRLTPTLIAAEAIELIEA
jgi:hypothetical protein